MKKDRRPSFMKKIDQVILWSGGIILVIFLLTQRLLESKSISFRGNYYTLFISLTVLPILISLFWLIPKLIKKYTDRKILSIMIRAVFGIFIISFSGVMVYEFTTLSEDVVVIDGVSYVSNVRSQNIKYNIDGVYYEIINDYFVKEPFSFTQKIEKK
jgi:hypothetical protein